MSACARPASTRLLGQHLAVLHALALVASGLCSASVEAAIRVLADRPTAVEGAPLLVPVRVEGAERGAVPMRAFAAGGVAVPVEGRLLWPVRPDPLAFDGARWASASNELRLVVDRPEGATDAFLAIELPPEAGAAASIEFQPGGRIAPRWLPAPPEDLLARLAVRVSAIVPSGAPDARLSRPDPDAPFERFRFAIGCALRGWDAPPALDPASPDGIAARATTAVWLGALARVAEASEGTATEIAELLVATCHDPEAPAPIAAWIADPTELATLLALAVDSAKSGPTLAEAVASWLRVRSPLILWVDEESADSILLAIANPGSSEEVVRLSWLDSVWLDEHDAPLAALVPPAEVAHVRIARPARRGPDDAPKPKGEDRDGLRIEHRGQARAITVSPDALPAGPTGPSLVVFRRPLSLVAASTGAAISAPDALRTFVSLRPRIVGSSELLGWEVFVEARCTKAPSADDAVTIVGAKGTAVTVRGDGSVDDPSGVLGGATVEWKVYPDRYRLSFQLPPAWIERVSGSALVELGVRRSGAQGSVDTPFACTPWRRLARTVRFDLLAR